MDPLKNNKYAAAVLIALLLGLLSFLVARLLVAPSYLDTNVYTLLLDEPVDPLASKKEEVVVSIHEFMAKASVEEGGVAARRKCSQCHTFDKGGANRVGPNLYAVVGTKSGDKNGYSFSTAMKNKEILWDTDTLDAYLLNPRGYVPGTKMSFAGLKDPQERANVIKYLESLR